MTESHKPNLAKKKKPKKKASAPIPTKDAILAFIGRAGTHVGKREIARAFNLKGQDKIALKTIRKGMAEDGEADKNRGKATGAQGVLSRVDVIEIIGTDKDGDLFAKPAKWALEGPPPPILVIQDSSKYKRRGKHHRETVGVGDRVLARLSPAGNNTYEARPIKRLKAAPTRLLGVYETDGDGGRLRPVDKKYRYDVMIAPGDAGAALSGDLVAAEVFESPKYGPQRARVLERLGPKAASRNLSLIAIHAHGIPHAFSDDAVAQADNSKAAPLGNRVDLRQMPLVTIDGEDARDFDDAVWAEADPSRSNSGGWHLVVAIADVACYVRPGDALDRDAYARGNSVYFPDKVVPMLPEALSNGWCSLKPNEDRPCLAVHMWITANGKLLRHEFIRGLMRSQARLTYTQVQAAHDGNPDELTASLVDTVIAPLYSAFEALQSARHKRGTLDLNLVERKIVVDEQGHVLGIVPRPRYDSHKLIEEFMISANVAAALALDLSAYPAVFRVHDCPDPERIDALREALQTLDLKFPHAGSIRPTDFNRLLKQVRGGSHEHMVNMLVLRTQAQAVYSPDNIGHFGLGLQKYAHFTSPIRRYADLLVHRALIAAKNLGADGWSKGHDPDLHAITAFISTTERRAAAAERQSLDRFTAAYLSDRAGAIFRGRVNGVARFGAFITLDATGADGILPMRHLPQDFYDLDEQNHLLRGRRYGMQLRVGDVIHVRLLETDEVSGSIVFEYADQLDRLEKGPAKGKPSSSGAQPRKGPPAGALGKKNRKHAHRKSRK